MRRKTFSIGKSFQALAVLAILLCAPACGSRRARVQPPAARSGSVEEGIASWYGEPYHGRRAANGEIYDMDEHTAAHPTFPFETWLRVHHLGNGRDTEVRVIDRGPFVKGRIVDLSRAAARELEMIREGTARVRITVIDPPKEYERRHRFTIQVSSLREKERAEGLRKMLDAEFKEVEVRYRKANPKGGHPEMWRVLVGNEERLDGAQRLLEKVRERFPNAFVVPRDVE